MLIILDTGFLSFSAKVTCAYLLQEGKQQRNYVLNLKTTFSLTEKGFKDAPIGFTNTIVRGLLIKYSPLPRAAVVHFQAGSTFPGPVCTVSPGHWLNKSRHSIGLAGATRLTREDFRMNLLLLKGQGCVLQK